ncbi:MAG: HAD-IIB family hydrolase [Candidatus Saccharicenans sp.]|nr:HAD-IIB family hydrolase [Candidatus Saccharicenans sp.]MDI6848802.1 HAD-IIB family hydrolase [Candidatus Saccharicenans sp.]
MAVRFVIFSDLDATLLDHETYGFQPARPVLKKLKKMGIPVVLCTSKTRSETEAIATKLGLNHPFIVENGGAIFIPEGYFADSLFKKAGISIVNKGKYRLIQLGTPYPRLRSIFKAIREAVGIRMLGFGDLNADEIAAISGLGQKQAELARKREYDEPFFLEGSPEFELIEKKRKSGQSRINEKAFFERPAESEFCKTGRRVTSIIDGKGARPDQNTLLSKIKPIARRYGLRITAGGRFYHLTGDNDKGRAVRRLKKLYRLQQGKIIAIGLGDSANDWPMLKVVDLPVLVARPDGRHLKIPGKRKDLLRTTRPGSEGWAQAVNFFLSSRVSSIRTGRATAGRINK